MRILQIDTKYELEYHIIIGNYPLHSGKIPNLRLNLFTIEQKVTNGKKQAIRVITVMTLDTIDNKTLIDRTVTIKREFGSTRDSNIQFIHRTKDNNPKLFGTIESYCNRVFNKMYIENGVELCCNVVINHALLDGMIASEHLYSYLDGKFKEMVNIYYPDQIHLNRIIDLKKLVKAAEKKEIIEKNKLKFVNKLMIILTAIFTVIVDFLPILTYINPGLFIALPTYLKITITVLTVLFIILLTITGYSKNSNEMQNKLLSVINELSIIELKSLFECLLSSIDENAFLLSRNKINIFSRFDKIENWDMPCKQALLCYLNKSSKRSQVNIIFMQSSSKDIIDNKNYTKAELYIDQYTYQEKKELIRDKHFFKKVNNFTDDTLKYYGLDAIIDKDFKMKLSEKEQSDTDIIKTINDLRNLNIDYGCEIYRIIHAISYFTSRFDLYLDEEEFEDLIKDTSGGILGKNFLMEFLKISNNSLFNCRELISIIINSFGENDNYINKYNDYTKYKYKYKFTREFCEYLFLHKEYRDLLKPNERNLLLWTINQLLKSKFCKDVEQRISFCTEIFVELSSHSFKNDIEIFCEIVLQLFELCEGNDSYYTYETLFEILLEYGDKFNEVKRYCHSSTIIQNADLHNFLYSPGKTSWLQSQKFAKQCSSLIPKSDKIHVSNTIAPFDIISMNNEDRINYYENLLTCKFNRTIKFIDELYNLYLYSISDYLELYDIFSINEYEDRDFNDILENLINYYYKISDYGFLNNYFKLLNSIIQNIDNPDVEKIYAFYLLSEYIEYPVTKFFTNIVKILYIHHDKMTKNSPLEEAAATIENQDEYIQMLEKKSIEDELIYDMISTNLTFSFIQLSLFIYNTSIDKVEFAFLLDLIIQNSFSKDLKSKLLIIYCTYYNLYNNDICLQLAGKEDIHRIINIAINNNKLKEDNLLTVFTTLLIVNISLNDSQLFDDFQNYVNKKFPEQTRYINETIDILIKGNIKDIDGFSLLLEWHDIDLNIAYIILFTLCRTDETYLKHFTDNRIIDILKESIFVNIFGLLGFYLISEYCDRENEHTKDILYIFLNHKESCYLESDCLLAYSVIDIFSDKIELIEEKSFFIQREFQIQNDLIKKSSYYFNSDNPFGARSYLIFLQKRIIMDDIYNIPKKTIQDKVFLDYQSNSKNELFILRLKQFIKDNFLTIKPANEKCDSFNTPYFIMSEFIFSNSLNIQKELSSIYGNNMILEKFRKDAICLIQLILNLLQVSEQNALLLTQLKETRIIIESISNKTLVELENGNSN